MLAKAPISIHSLPAETLTAIFHYLHDDQELRATGSKILLDSTNFPNGARFPYNIVRVCKNWKLLVESIPAFWASIMLFLDETAAQRDLERQFNLSLGRHIKVFVIRKTYPEDTNDLMEHEVVDSIVYQLSKHVERCKVIVFDVLHSTSIPRLNAFSGTSTELKTLRIRCRRGPSGAHVNHRLPLSKQKPFICPNLQYIDLQGRTFLEALKVPDWLDSVRRIPGKSLEISDLSREEAGNFDLRALIISLSSIGPLASLKLSNIDIDVGKYAQTGGPAWVKRAPATISVQNFDFVGLSGEFIQAFFSAYDNKFDVSRLTLAQCGLGKVKGLEAWDLLIENCRVTESELISFLEGWNGFSLELYNVAEGVTDRLFDRLSRSTSNSRGKNLFAIPTLRLLTIMSQEPLPLSPEMLKKMILARKAEADRFLDIPAIDHFLGLFKVTIIRSMNAISAEDRSLISNCLEEFYWAGPMLKSEIEPTDDISSDESVEAKEDSEVKDDAIDDTTPPSTRSDAPVFNNDRVKGEPLDSPDKKPTVLRSESPILDNDCADWDFSEFDDSQIGMLMAPSATSQTAATLGTMKLDMSPEVNRSPSPEVKDDYCDMDWSSLDI